MLEAHGEAVTVIDTCLKQRWGKGGRDSSRFSSPSVVNHLALPLYGSGRKNPPAVQETRETQVQSLGQEDPLEQENGNLL